MGEPLTLEWFGCATFRVRAGGLTLFFDTYLDKIPGSPEVSLSCAAVDAADYVFVSHAHFDHLLGADIVARATGATAVGSYECARILRDNGVPVAQILPASGGETIPLRDGYRVRVYPSLHSCLFAQSSQDSGESCIGDIGVGHPERLARVAALFEAAPALLPGAAAFLAESDPRSSRLDGGPLIYVLDTPHGSIYVNGSPGYWTGIVRDLSPDVAIVSLTGRPNIDGEPIQGSLADYLVEHVSLLGARRTVICHHDVLLPGLIPAVDTSEAIARLGRDVSGTALVNLEYDEPVPVLRERPL